MYSFSILVFHNLKKKKKEKKTIHSVMQISSVN